MVEVDPKDIFAIFDKIYANGKVAIEEFNNPKKTAQRYLIEQIEKNNLNQDTLTNACMIMQVNKILKKSKNFINIVNETSRIMDQTKQINTPDEDWLLYFEELSSNVSNEALQKMWARILAKEMTDSSSGITRAMLNTISLLDKKSAEDFIKLCSLVYEVEVVGGNSYTIPFVLYDIDLYRVLPKNDPLAKLVSNDYLSYCPSQVDLQYLDDLGLIRLAEADRGSDIYSQEAMSLVFKGINKSIKSGSIYDEDGHYYYIVTGQVNFSSLGLALYHSVSSTKYPYLDVLLEEFVLFQNSEEYKKNPL